MSWKDDLRAGIAAAVGRHDRVAASSEETDAERKEVLQQALGTAAKVLRLARTELELVEIGATCDFSGGARRLTLDGSTPERFVEAVPILNGLAIKVHRHSGIIDLLHVESGVVVDSRRTPIGSLEHYFGSLVIDLVREMKRRST